MHYFIDDSVLFGKPLSIMVASTRNTRSKNKAVVGNGMTAEEILKQAVTQAEEESRKIPSKRKDQEDSSSSEEESDDEVAHGVVLESNPGNKRGATKKVASSNCGLVDTHGTSTPINKVSPVGSDVHQGQYTLPVQAGGSDMIEKMVADLVKDQVFRLSREQAVVLEVERGQASSWETKKSEVYKVTKSEVFRYVKFWDAALFADAAGKVPSLIAGKLGMFRVDDNCREDVRLHVARKKQEWWDIVKGQVQDACEAMRSSTACCLKRYIQSKFSLGRMKIRLMQWTAVVVSHLLTILFPHLFSIACVLLNIQVFMRVQSGTFPVWMRSLLAARVQVRR